MHELALMEDLVCTVTEELRADDRVAVVRLVVGRRTAVVPDSLHFCFEICTRGTALEGASLEIRQTEGEALRLEELEVY